MIIIDTDHAYYSFFASVGLNDFIFAIKAFASGSVSKWRRTGSISSLMVLATAGFRSPGCSFPSWKSAVSSSNELYRLSYLKYVHIAAILRLTRNHQVVSHSEDNVFAVVNNRITVDDFLRTKSLLNFSIHILRRIFHENCWVRVALWHFLLTFK